MVREAWWPNNGSLAGGRDVKRQSLYGGSCECYWVVRKCAWRGLWDQDYLISAFFSLPGCRKVSSLLYDMLLARMHSLSTGPREIASPNHGLKLLKPRAKINCSLFINWYISYKAKPWDFIRKWLQPWSWHPHALASHQTTPIRSWL